MMNEERESSEDVILVLGNYCSSNRGDEAILDGLISLLKEWMPSASIVVSSFYPDIARELHGVEAVEPILKTTSLDFRSALRYAFKAIVFGLYALSGKSVVFARLIPDDRQRILEIYSKAALVVSAGGAYLNDNYRPAILGRLYEIYLGRLFGKYVVLCAHSVGPFRIKWYRYLARFVFNRVNLITTRDSQSKEIVQALGVTRPRTIVTADTAFALSGGSASINKDYLLSRGIPADRPLISISARFWPFYEDDVAAGHANYVKTMAELCDYLTTTLGGAVVFLSTCTGYGGYPIDDRVVAREIRSIAKNCESIFVLEDEHTPVELIGLYGLMDMHIGTRMHSNILAALAGTPFVAIAYEFKTFGLLEQLGLKRYVCDIEHITFGKLQPVVDEAWLRREALRETLQKGVAGLKIQSGRNIAYIDEVLRRSKSQL